MAVANLAYRCLNLIGKNRPTMKEVVVELEGIQKSSKLSSDDQKIFQKAAYQMPEVVAEAWDFPCTSIGSSSCSTAATLSLVNASM